MRIRASMTAALVLMAAGAGTAAADTIDLHFLGTGQGRDLRYVIDGNPEDNWVGQLIHSMSNGVGPAGEAIEGIRRTYCSEIRQHVTVSGATYLLEDLADMPDGDGVDLGAMRAQVIADLYSVYAPVHEDAAVANDFAAAFQIAIWEVIEDFDVGLGLASINPTAGSLTFSETNGDPLGAGIQAALGQIMVDLAVFAGTGDQSLVLGLTNDRRQDQFVSVPTPGALVMGAAGALCLVRRRRK